MEEIINISESSWIIDCNVVIKWFLIKEEDSSNALTLLQRAKDREIFLFAPAMILIEFGNVLTKHNKYNPTFKTNFIRYYQTFTGICDTKVLNLIPLENERQNVLDLALDEKISYFDAEYLYLSRKLKFELITYDKGLKKIANR